MTLFRESIQSIEKSSGFGIPPVSFPDELYTAKAYQIVQKALGEGSPVEPPKDPEVWIELAKQTNKNSSWQSLTRHELRNMALVLWQGESCIADNDDLLNNFLIACEAQSRKRLVNCVVRSYLYNYSEKNASCRSVGEWLEKAVLNWEWNWKNRQESLKMFGSDKAPDNIAEAIFHLDLKVDAVLTSCGLVGALQTSGMGQAAFRQALNKFSTLDSRGTEGEKLALLKRLLAWATIGGEKFSYPLLRTKFIDSLLLPWENKTPSVEIKTLIQGFLVETFNDPRLGGANWLGISEISMRVIRSWLVERALAQFLDVVDDLTRDADMKHQWKYRRAFWMAYYKKDVISDAWVAFAANGANQARQIAKRQDDASWLSFGQMQGSGDPNHAVLILKIGDLTIADFSHNGKCRLWNKGNESMPKPYEKFYDRSDFMSAADHEEIHSNSPGYLWQGRVAAKIASWTNVRISQTEYVPR